MGIGIAGAAFIGAIIGGATSAGIAFHSGGDPIKAGLLGTVAGGASGAAGGWLAGPAVGGAVGTATEGAIGGGLGSGVGSSASSIAGGALGNVLDFGLPAGYLMATPAAGSAAGLSSSLTGSLAAGVGEMAGAFLEGGTTAPKGFDYTSLIKPGIQVGGQIASALTQPEMPEYPQPIAPPLRKVDDAIGVKRWEATPEAIDAQNQRARRADEMYKRARAMDELRRTSIGSTAREQGGYTFDEYFQKPRTSKERLIGVEPTIGAARH